jgi:hypothetical protein
MERLLDIRVQKLFLITIVLKVGSSFLGWQLESPWILGLFVPLAIMAAYILIGIKRRDTDVSDEKFADSCYYLGFIFTITSIIFCLFDIAKIVDHLIDIAVRFGAAMASTVVGLTVRVYLVSFKGDVSDAIKDTEDAVIDASRRFCEQLVIACEKLKDFQSEVDTAAKGTVERINLQVESLSKNHSENLTDFFADLTQRNQEAFTLALDEVRRASLQLSSSVDGYSEGMRTNLSGIESKVSSFADAMTNRLKSTTFPDEYFSKSLAGPLSQLTASTSAISQGIDRAAVEVRESTVLLGTALKSLRTKATSTETSLDKVISLTTQQQAVLNAAQGQLTVLETLTNTLSSFDKALASTVEVVRGNSTASAEIAQSVGSLVAEGAVNRKALEDALKAIAVELGANADATVAVVGRLDDVVIADTETAKVLNGLGQHASGAIGKVDAAVENLQTIAQQFSSLDSTLRSQSSEILKVVERFGGARAMSPSAADETTSRFGYERNAPELNERSPHSDTGLFRGWRGFKK